MTETRRKTTGAVGIDYQIPRNSLVLLMVAQIAVVVPHAVQLSPWIIAVGLFCGYWRWMVYLGRWAYPKRWVKAILVVAAAFGLSIGDAGAFSLETASSLCILAFALKLIEMTNRRDAYLLIFLAYFIVATEFLFDQSLLVALYEVFALVVVTAAMIGLNQLHTKVRPMASLKLASVLVLQALPLMVVIFLFFPRIAPLWSIPLPSSATTGISDRMKPGDIANLTQSDEVAFRAVFAGPPPANRDLYWRGLVYSQFHLGTWSVGAKLARSDYTAIKDAEAARAIRYVVLQEPSQAKWLFALDVATTTDTSRGVSVTGDYRLTAIDPVMSIFRYDVISYPNKIMDKLLPPPVRGRELWLPEGDNPRVRVFAEERYQQSNSVEEFLDSLLQDIRNKEYVYTLSPPTLADNNSIDEFWLGTRRGFCAHYAGAFVFMVRSVGIPARMVGGYQGGEINESTGNITVRQYDAHAWAEVWIEDRGWVRYDPTAAVAPSRIESGLNAALSAADRAQLSAFTTARWDGLFGISQLLEFADSLEHRWNLWVVGYDTVQQTAYLKKLIGEITPAKIGLVMLIGISTSLALVFAALFWRHRPAQQHRGVRLLKRFEAGLRRSGVIRKPAETPGKFLARAAHAGQWNSTQSQSLVEAVNRVLYNPDFEESDDVYADLKSQLRRLRLRLIFG